MTAKVILLCIIVISSYANPGRSQWNERYEDYGIKQRLGNTHKKQHRVYNNFDGNGYATSIIYYRKPSDKIAQRSFRQPNNQEQQRLIRPHKFSYSIARTSNVYGHYSVPTDNNRYVRTKKGFRNTDYFNGLRYSHTTRNPGNNYFDLKEHRRRINGINSGKSFQYFRSYKSNGYLKRQPSYKRNYVPNRNVEIRKSSSRSQNNIGYYYATPRQYVASLTLPQQTREPPSYSNQVKRTPISYDSSYNIQPEEGADLWRMESGDDSGGKTGEYGYKDPNGTYRRVKYKADENGFRAWIETNEPGSVNSNPADVSVAVEDKEQRGRDNYY